MNLSQAQLGFIRGLGVVAITAILSYLGDAAHLTGVLNATAATIVAALALSLEQFIESKGKGALFGAVN